MKKLLFIFLLAITFKQNVLSAEQPLAAFKIDSLWHIIDETGSPLLNPLKIRQVHDYSEGFYTILFDYEGKARWAFMDDFGNIGMPECHFIRNFSEGRAMLIHVLDTARQLRMYGYIDRTGTEVIRSVFLDALDFREGKAWVMNRNSRGYIDTNGVFVIKLDGEKFGNVFSEGLAGVINEESLYGFIDEQGKIAIDYSYDEVGEFSEDLVRVNALGLWGFIDRTGKIVIDVRYDFALDFSYGHAFVGRAVDSYDNPLWGIVNKANITTVDFTYEDVRNFTEGKAAVKYNNKWRFINFFGEKIIEREFDAAEQFRNGLAWAVDRETKEQGWITPDGNFLIRIPEEATSIIDLRLNKQVK